MDDVAAVLRQCELFGGLDDVVIEGLAENARSIDLADGDLVFGVGDPREKFYVIVDGHLGVGVGEGVGSGARILLGPNEAIGEAALVDPSRHTATVHASGGVRVL